MYTKANRFILLFGLLVSNYSYSCSCDNWMPTTEQYLKNCESIFTARLIDAKYIEAIPDPKYATFPALEGTLSSPVEVFKGNPKGIAGLSSGMSGTSCEGRLDVGKIYIVCAKSESYVSVAQCGLTSPIEWGKGKAAYELFKKREE